LKKVGDGSNTFFWTYPWLGGAPLCERFGRLFDLIMNKSSTVAEMFAAGWEAGGEAWVWRIQLWAWAGEMLGECQSLLLLITVQAQTPDRWQWQPDPDVGYSVRGAYQLLTSLDSFTLREAENLVWHKQVPLKVFILACRLLRDRLPNEIKLGSPRHYLSRGSLLRVWLRQHRIGSTPVSLLQHFWILMGISSFLDWFFGGRCPLCPRSLCSVHLLSWRSPSSPVVFAAHLASLRLGCLD
jgi:hypothetical protein